MPKRFGTAGPRAIFPAACTSLSLAACDPLAQLLFDRMLTQADDQGRMLGDPKVIKSLCMPLVNRASPKAIAKWLEQIETQGMIVRYEVDGTSLIQFVNWWDHQSGMKKSYPSRLQPPTGWTDRIRGVAGDDSGDDGGTSSPGGGKFPPSAGAPSAAAAAAAANPAAAAPQPPNGFSPSGDDDHLDAWYRLTGSWPTPKVLPWLNELAAKYRGVDLAAAMGVEWASDQTRSTFLGRVRDRLGREEHLADKRRRAAAKAAGEDEKRRIEEMPAEQREANLKRLRDAMAESGLAAKS